MSNTNIANDNDEREPEWIVCYSVFGATIVIGHYKTEEEAKAAAEASKIQDAKIAGAEKSRSLQYKKTGNQLAAASGEYAAAGAAKDQASRDQMSAVGSIASSVIGG